MIVVPDADLEPTAKGLLASSMGSAGQRCMAASVAVGVADVDPIINQLTVEAKMHAPINNAVFFLFMYISYGLFNFQSTVNMNTPNEDSSSFTEDIIILKTIYRLLFL